MRQPRLKAPTDLPVAYYHCVSRVVNREFVLGEPEKEQFRNLERAYADSHVQRLVENTLQSIETSALHLDIIRDLKRINSHICSIAYPILESAGVLSPTRLREAKRRGRAAAPAANGNGKPREGPLGGAEPKA